MNVLIISPYPPDCSYGGGQRLFGIMEALKNNSNMYIIVTQKNESQYDGNENIHYVDIKEDKIITLFRKVFPFYCIGVKRLVEKVRILDNQIGYDFIICRYPRTLEILGKLKKTKIILDIDDIEYERKINKFSKENNFVRKTMLFISAYLSLLKFKKVIRAADYLWIVKKEDYKIIGNRKALVVPNVAFIAPISKEDQNYIKIEKPVILYIAHFAYPPNREGLRWFLEEVWPLILKNNNNVQFNIVGKCKDISFIEYITKSQNVNYLGYVEQLSSVYSNATLCINPCKSGAGTQIKVIEAMLMGKIIITTSYGGRGWNDAISVCNCPIVATDSKNYADLCLHFLKEESKRVLFENNAYEYAKKYGTIEYLTKIITKAISN